MNRDRKLSRRSFLATVTGSGLALVPLGRATGQGSPALPTAVPEAVDSDKGFASDNNNLGGARSGGLRGRVNRCSDEDSGPGSDPLGESRLRNAWSDGDRGPKSDPSRICPRPWYGR